MFSYYFFHTFCYYAGETYWSVISCTNFFPFLYIAVICPFFQSVGSLPSLKLLLNIRVNGLHSCGANYLRNLGCNPSGPWDLLIFSFCSIFLTCSSVMLSGFIVSCIFKSG